MLIAVLLLAGPGLVFAGQDSAGSTAAAHQDSPDTPGRIGRIAAVGASATAGFGIVVPQDTALGRIPKGWSLAQSIRVASGEEVVVSDLGTGFFFMAPHSTGEKLMARALKAGPDLLVAVDFLFWFAYGTQGPNQEQMRSPAERLAMLEVGLAILDTYDGPIIVGDLPDMSGAIGKMLSRRQVPSPATLETLNARIHEWIDARPRVRLFPLAGFMEKLRAGKAFDVGDHRWQEADLADVLQRDQLHPTLLGQVALVQVLDVVLDEHDMVSDIRPELDADRDSMLQRIQGKGETGGDPNPGGGKGDAATPDSSGSSLRQQFSQRLSG
ncbi:MAG: hypothetical protein MK085_02240 [Phycisphaerales bacterium]|nr:hypothetical protein [Phycisphaerales bacterium]